MDAVREQLQDVVENRSRRPIYKFTKTKVILERINEMQGPERFFHIGKLLKRGQFTAALGAARKLVREEVDTDDERMVAFFQSKEELRRFGAAIQSANHMMSLETFEELHRYWVEHDDDIEYFYVNRVLHRGARVAYNLLVAAYRERSFEIVEAMRRKARRERKAQEKRKMEAEAEASLVV